LLTTIKIINLSKIPANDFKLAGIFY